MNKFNIFSHHNFTRDWKMIDDLDVLMKEIIERYNRTPKGWRFISDYRGNIIIIGPDISYQFKTMMINPSESIGVGTRISNSETLRKLTAKEFDSGFRSVDESKFHALISGKISEELILELLRKSPAPLHELEESKIILGGPIFSHPDIRMLSKSQQELESKLAIELDKLFRRKYPHRANIYW